MLELAILGLLKERSMHGYQLSKRLTDALGGLLARLVRLAVPHAEAPRARGRRRAGLRRGQPSAAARTSTASPRQGEALFLELLEEAGHDTSTEDNRFRVRLAFFKYLAPEARIRLLERRRAYLEDRLSTITASLADTRERFDTYTLSLMQHGRETTEQDIAWLNGLIAAERRAADHDSTTGSSKRREARALRRKERTT